MTPKILVTSAAGKTGMSTALQLLEKDYPVRALVRGKDARSRLLHKAGAEVVVGDLHDIDSLREAFSGCQRAYWCAPVEAHPLHKMSLFAIAAAEAKVEHIVHLSQWLSASSHPSVATREVWMMDKILDWIPGATITINNTGWFADNYALVMLPMAQLGMMPMPLGDGRNAPPSNEDIAAVNVGALISPEDHAGQTYRPTGPALLTPQEIADAFGRALGRTVRYDNASMKMFLKALAAQKRPEFAQSQLAHYVVDYQQDAFARGAPTDVVERVGGRQPQTIDEIARHYVQTDPDARQTLINKVRALSLLSKIFVATPLDREKFAQSREFPMSRTPTYAAKDDVWLETHQENGERNSANVTVINAAE
ncbi:MAG: NmrA family NAD(P)-binding protein [Rhodobiaceae bacterium]|nr:NmrA family NAD(P)-binding protein [Rhodobiaceae bacterium]